jgi:hypothetical protein
MDNIISRERALDIAAIWYKARPSVNPLTRFLNTGRIETGMHRFSLTAFIVSEAMPEAFALLQADPSVPAFLHDIESLAALHHYVLYAPIEPTAERIAA